MALFMVPPVFGLRFLTAVAEVGRDRVVMIGLLKGYWKPSRRTATHYTGHASPIQSAEQTTAG
jgi:hypothetical protein